MLSFYQCHVINGFFSRGVSKIGISSLRVKEIGIDFNFILAQKFFFFKGFSLMFLNNESQWMSRVEDYATDWIKRGGISFAPVEILRIVWDNAR